MLYVPVFERNSFIYDKRTETWVKENLIQQVLFHIM